MKEYFDKYNKISFFMACMIVIRHSLNYTEYLNITKGVYYFEKFVYCFTGFATMLFALLAGYNLFLVESEKALFSKLKKRIYSLLIPYVIGVTINWLLFAVLPYLPVVKKYISGRLYPLSMKSYIITLLTGGGTPLWYLRNLIIMVIISPLIYKIIFINKKVAIASICILLGIWCFFPKDQFSIFYFSVVYLVGAYIAQYYSEKWMQIEHKRLWFILLLLLLVLDTFFHFSEHEQIRLPYTIICACIFWKSCNFTRIKKYDFMKFSFGIYIYHYFINECLNKFFYVFLGDTMLGALINLFLSPVISIALLLGIFYFIKKVKPNIISVILGGRI